MRQYLLKETDLSVWSEANLDDIADELNGRPCKTLDKDLAPTIPYFGVVGAKRFYRPRATAAAACSQAARVAGASLSERSHCSRIARS